MESSVTLEVVGEVALFLLLVFVSSSSLGGGMKHVCMTIILSEVFCDIVVVVALSHSPFPIAIISLMKDSMHFVDEGFCLLLPNGREKLVFFCKIFSITRKKVNIQFPSLMWNKVL